MELVPRESELIRAALSIEKTVVLVLVTSDADRGEVIMIDPDLGRCFNVNKIHPLRGAVELDVPDDDIVGFLDPKSAVGNTSVFSDTEN